ncbi:Spheroplast protein Y precursor [Cedecea neteri]|uniref:Spheroplast protein Y n=1 Tax=Cedecea neteri TaxID=158822 RepID=A0A2X3JDQ2_9ENTR|nr:Spheroplast protein Y precursor [Cedecea neteri]
MHDVIASDSFDQAKAQAQVDKMAEQNKTRMLAHLQTQNKIYNILTPDQKKQFNANFEKRLTERPGHEGKNASCSVSLSNSIKTAGLVHNSEVRCEQDRRFSRLILSPRHFPFARLK